MADKTSIEWTDASWPVVTGCDHISPGCDNCYAAKLTSTRLRHLPAYEGLAENGRFNGTVRLLPERLDWPLKWRKGRKIFVSDMADLFHKDVPDEYIARVWTVMANAPQHSFQVLTKRHARMRSVVRRMAWRLPTTEERQQGVRGSVAYVQRDEALNRHLGEPEVLPNVWLGVSVEDQKWADIRIPALLETPAAVRFISAEPLLGPVVLRDDWIGADPYRRDEPSLSWVIVGGESGPGARPMHPSWARSLRDQCQGRAAFHFKQWGSWAPYGDGRPTTAGQHVAMVFPDGRAESPRLGAFGNPALIARYSKKAAGRELDGRTWDGFPQEVSLHG